MKILKLTAENLMKLKVVEITPGGNIVEITGSNGSGKTSVLNAIWFALAGLSNIPDKPIREGEDKAAITLDLGEFVVTRTFSNKEEGEGYTSTLKVESKEGKKFNSPQDMLNQMIGSLSFNPLGFTRASNLEQLNMVKALIKGFDFAANEAEEKKTYEERTIVNRKAKDASLRHISFKDVPLPEPEKVDVKAITDSMAEASDKNTERQRQIGEKDKKITAAQQEFERLVDLESNCKLEVEHTQQNINKLNEKRIKLEEEIKALDQEAQTQRANKVKFEEEQIKAAQDQVMAKNIWDEKKAIQVPDEVSVEDLKKQLEEAQTKNKLHDTWVKRNEAKAEIEAHEAEAKALTDKIELLRAQRLEAIKNSGLPIEGLGVSDDSLTLNGIPLKQASSAEQLRVSCAIAMSMNPQLRVIRVQDGSLLDENGMKILADMAEKNDFQIWVEAVDGSGKVGIFMEDGSVKAVNS